MPVSVEQLENAPLPMETNPSLRVALVSAVQFSNALLPMVVTLPGILMLVSSSHLPHRRCLQRCTEPFVPLD